MDFQILLQMGLVWVVDWLKDKAKLASIWYVVLTVKFLVEQGAHTILSFASERGNLIWRTQLATCVGKIL